MSAEHHSVYDLIHLDHSYHYAAAAGLSAIILGFAGLAIRSKANSKLEVDDVLPDGRWTFFNTMVEFLAYFRKLLQDMIGHDGEKYLPIVFGTFLLILTNNLSGFIPGLISPSENLINNLSMALFVFLAYQFFGLKEHGLHYFKQFTGGLPPKGYGMGVSIVLSLVAVMVFFIEVIGHIVRPFSLSLRLWGTVTGDHALLSVATGVMPLVLPMLAMTLGLLVSVVQALVFSLLSTVYIKLAVSHDH